MPEGITPSSRLHGRSSEGEGFMSENHDDLIGRSLGQYTIIEEIGRGGMATVYRAMQQSINRVVAVKVLPRHLMHDPSFLERFEREVEVISQLEHPHILPIYDYGHDQGVPYIAMRYLGGGSLADRIHTSVPSIEQIEQPLNQIAQALDYAHKQSIIHRDLKPGNIMLDENDNAYLSDFGIARVMGSELTGSAIIGTPAYMSPEQAHGIPLDGRSDVYALGIVLFELLTGHEPFQAETPMGMLLMHIQEPLPSLSRMRSDIPPAIESVVVRATAKTPNERYASAGEMAQAFTEALRGKSRTRPNATRPNADVRAATGVSPAPRQAKAEPLSGPATVAQPGPATTGAGATSVASGAGRWILGALVIVLAIGGLALASGLFNPAAASQPLLSPTPFRSAVTISYDDVYSISIPERWLPPFNDYVDTSTTDVIQHEWPLEDASSYVRLSIHQSNSLSMEELASQAAQAEGLSFIDEASAPNGTLRRSYRVAASAGQPAGQLDQFIIPGDEELALLEFFISDASASTPALVNTLQAILDSLRLA